MKLALSLAAVVAGTSHAFAGGYSVPVAQPEPMVAVAPVSGANWTGAYGGVTLGYGMNGNDEVGVSNGGTPIAPGTLEVRGANFGIHGGYRWQRDFNNSAAVFGIELGLEGGPVKDSFTQNGYEAHSKLKQAIALRVKGGVLNEARNTLVYGILGASSGTFDYKVAGPGMNYDSDVTTNGWIAVIGVERKVSDRMSIVGEIEKMGFRSKEVQDAGGASTVVTPGFTNVKLGVNFSF